MQQYELTEYISNSLTQVFAPARGQRVKYTTNVAGKIISTANPNLDGITGTYSTAIIIGAGNGTLLQKITVQAQGTTTDGMVRLFLYNALTKSVLLFHEIEIPNKVISTGSGIDKAFSKTLNINFLLPSSFYIVASTQKAETFNVIIEGLDTTFP